MPRVRALQPTTTHKIYHDGQFDESPESLVKTCVVVIPTARTRAHPLWIFPGRARTGSVPRTQPVTPDTTAVVTVDFDSVEYTNSGCLAAACIAPPDTECVTTNTDIALNSANIIYLFIINILNNTH